MGYRLIEYVGTEVRVRLEWEKGFWDLDLADVAVAPDVWYNIKLFTYILGGRPMPTMKFEKQLEYAKRNWGNIVGAFSQKRKVKTHVLLDAAKKERGLHLYAIWPDAVRDLELFLRENGLVRTYRKEPRFMFDSMLVRYANARIAVQMHAQKNDKDVDFADFAHVPDRWYSFDTMRRFLQWPEDKKLRYGERFVLIKENWPKIVDSFSPANTRETHKRLRQLEQIVSNDDQGGDNTGHIPGPILRASPSISPVCDTDRSSSPEHQRSLVIDDPNTHDGAIMEILDSVQKHYPMINNAAGDFLTKLTGTDIKKDIAVSAELAGLMLLRASSADLLKIPSGAGIIGAVPDNTFHTLTRFVLSMASSNGLSPKDADVAAIPADARGYLPELIQFEAPFYEICKGYGIAKEFFPFTAAASAVKLVLAGKQLGLLDARVGLAMVLFHLAAGSKTVPYPV